MKESTLHILITKWLKFNFKIVKPYLSLGMALYLRYLEKAAKDSTGRAVIMVSLFSKTLGCFIFKIHFTKTSTCRTEKFKELLVQQSASQAKPETVGACVQQAEALTGRTSHDTIDLASKNENKMKVKWDEITDASRRTEEGSERYFNTLSYSHGQQRY